MSRHQAYELTESACEREREAYRGGPWVEPVHGRHNETRKP